jgi:hypothetical protein
MKCEFCNNEFSNKQNLNAHQKRTKYCLKLQEVNRVIDKEKVNKCVYCLKEFNIPSNYKRHIKICKISKVSIKSDKKIMLLENKVENLENIIEELRKQLKDYKEDYKELSMTAVKRPTKSTKNIQINNYIKNMSPLLEEDLKSSIPMLTLEHHVKGAEGYAQYAMEFPFKDKIVTVDVARNKITYKNEEGDVIEDVGFKKMMKKLCTVLKDRSFNLSQEHYEKLSETFTEKEMDEFDFMEAAMAITKYANGRESDFSRDIIKMIRKGSTV